MRLQKTDYQIVLKEIRLGGTVKSVSEKTGISDYLVRKVAKFYNIKIETPPKKKNPLESQIIQMVLETGNGYLVDRTLGLAPGSSKRICRRLGVEYPMRFGRQKENKTIAQRISDNLKWKAIYELYSQDVGFREIERRLGLRYGAAARVLRNIVGGVGRGNNNPKKIYLPDSIGKMYLDGLGEKEIAEQFDGISRKVVRNKLRQLGIPKRVGKASGSKNKQWKGGREETVHRYRRQSYEVVAICLRKPLPKGHVIHHIDENPKNNYPSNLMIFPSGSLHGKFHQTVLKNQWKVDSEEAIRFALEIGGVPLPIPDFQIEL